MNWGMFQKQDLYSKFLRDRLNQLEMVLGNFFGHVNTAQMVSGLGSIGDPRRKESGYINKLHFRAQYYNDPHDVESSPIKREQFQYYEPAKPLQKRRRWYYQTQST